MERMKKPKFIKEIEKSEWKERAKCWRWYIRVYWELDHKPMVELESLEIIVKELHKLEEEVRFLEECLDRKEKLNEEYRKEIDNKKLSTIAEETISDLQARIKELKDRIDVLYEFIERNDKLVDEVIDEEDLDKLNRYIYIDDDLVDRTLESED